MSFQWIMDRAETFSINRLNVVAQTQTRNGIVRSVSRGSAKKRIEIKFPDGIAWTDLRTNIAAAEALGRSGTATISIPYAKYPWYYGNAVPEQNETYTVICTVFPQWTIFARDQVSWDSSFVFVEV